MRACMCSEQGAEGWYIDVGRNRVRGYCSWLLGLTEQGMDR